MKKISLLIISLLFVSFGLKAQNAQEKIEVTGAGIVRSGDEVSVTFSVQTKKNTVKRNFSRAIIPVITDGDYQVSLPAVIVRGKRAARLEARNEKFSSRPAEYPEPRIVSPGESVDYSASVPFQQWMEGATLMIESRSWGCCSSAAHPDMLLSENILPHVIIEKPAPVETPQKPLTTGDAMAQTFDFVIPESEWSETEHIYDEDRGRALIVHYHLNKSDLRPDYRENRMALVNMQTAVQAILESSDSRISRIVVAGFSSPEGPFTFNDKLAWQRAVAVKEYIMKNSGLPDKAISLYNGSEDWRGLRVRVAASDLRDKVEILQIIDTVPILSADGLRKERLQRLQKLNGGNSYRYMLNNFFPELRNGAFIRIYYTNDME